METPVSYFFTFALLLAVWLTASLAFEPGMKIGSWIGAGVVILAISVCAAFAPRLAFWSVVIAVAVLRVCRWFRDQEEMGPRASLLFRLL